MFRADLHIHSRFSRATSKSLTIPNLAAWAGAKGIDVLATGDFTHPVWRQELRDSLELDGNTGLYRLKNPLSRDDFAREIPQLAGMEFRSPQFMLEAEISSIYKKNGKVRKVHSLVYVPDLDSADKLCAKLEAIGNLKSDGRPILGLDVKDLLSMVLEIPRAYMIPAHIWTPWFALFGSKSGFDSLEECFEDLTPHIFAAETGLSSDPDMNRCWSHLDHLLMVSSSDAHSGENLAREATLFDGAATYDGIFDALHKKDCGTNYAGTLEFFPEEGKYHLDGHRACGVMLEPAECMKLGDICPVCGKPLTVGVLHRVLALADRTEAPEPGSGFSSVIPLPEILGELLHCGPKTKKVQEKYADLLGRFGSEMDILQNVPHAELGQFWPELGEAVRRMRSGQVIRQGGFDGEYGTIRLFDEAENAPSLLGKAPAARRKALKSEEANAPEGQTAQKKTSLSAETVRQQNNAKVPTKAPASFSPESFSPAQREALEAGPGPVLVLAGPGAGKTRTLIGRLVRLLKSGVPASSIAAVTFTRRAAEEMRERLSSALGSGEAEETGPALPETDTLHALALKRWPGEQPVVLSEEGARKAFHAANPELDKKEASRLYSLMELGRETLRIADDIAPLLDNYRRWKKERGLADYTDLPETWLAELKSRNYGAAKPWEHILVDEVQDLSPLQKALVEALTPADGSGFFGIGDPDQSIYSFRGADSGIEAALRSRWPDLAVLSLTESHRSAAPILNAGHDALAGRSACGELTSVTGTSATMQWMEAPSAEREAAWIADRIAYLIGGTSHQQADLHETLAHCHLEAGSCSPGEIAVLCRLKALIAPIRAALERRGIPCAAPEAEAFWNDERADVLLQAAAHFLQKKEHEEKEAAFLDASRFPLLAAMASAAPAAPRSAGPLDDVPASVWNQGPEAVLSCTQASAVFDPLFGESTAFRRLTRAWKEHGDWAALLEFVAFRREIDMVQGKAEHVQLMTIHASKGLEFKAVFIPAAEDGLLPFSGTDRLLGKEESDFTPPAREEEERLLYVGITRASEAVFLSSAARRTLFGHTLELPPSPLLPLAHFREVKLTRHTKKTASQLSLF